MTSVRYRIPEDKALCKVVVSIIEDGIIGVAQGSDSYWRRILVEFIALYDGNLNARTTKSLESRYSTIRREVGLYVGILMQRLRDLKSGQTEADMLKDTREEFEGQHGHPFGFEHCYEVLKQLRKFDPAYCNSSTAAVEEEAGSNPSTPTAPTQRFTAFPVDLSSQPNVSSNNPTSRPTGTKQQKRAKKSEIS